jgi:acetoacetate decarboxylase
MATLRYVKTLEQVKQARETNPEFMDSTVRSIRIEYETDPAIYAALIPQPLEAIATPEVCVTFSHVAMHISPEYTFEIGSAIFGVKASYDGQEGIYLVTMPMTTEQAVVPGRETFGEPKKIAEIDFVRDGDRVSATVSRMGFTYLSASGTLGEELGAREFEQYAYCYKTMPSCDQAKAFDADPLLVRLPWNQKHSNSWVVDGGELTLGESPMDPVADVPVRRVLRFEYEEGQTESNGTVLRSVPGDWILPFHHQRYDDTSGLGIEL